MPTAHEIEFLKELHSRNFTEGLTHMSYRDWCEARNVSGEECARSYQQLTDAGLMDAQAFGMTVGLTAEGICFLEDNRHVDAKFIGTQVQCRRLILRRGFEAYEHSGSRGRVRVHQLALEAEVHERVLHRNIFFLRDVLALEMEGQSFRLTERGVDLYQSVQFRDRIESRWEELCSGETMSPQVRGHALEDLLAELASFEGLMVDTRVRSPGEENDLVISKDHDHFLVSCKWEKTVAPNQYLEVLRMRVLKRPGTLGILVSVGGFSGELVREAESNTSLGMVMIFGRGDLDRLFRGEERLGDMMLDRHRTLARYRKAVFEP